MPSAPPLGRCTDPPDHKMGGEGIPATAGASCCAKPEGCCPPPPQGTFGSPWPGWLLSGERRFHLGGGEQWNRGVHPLAPPGCCSHPSTHTALLGGLTVQSWHKILQGFAVEGEGGRGVPLLILLHRLHHQIGLGETKEGSGLGHHTCPGTSTPAPPSPPCQSSQGRGRAPYLQRGA